MATTAAVIPALAAFDHAQAPAIPPADAKTSDAPITVEEITPAAADEKSTVRVSGQITNTTDKALTDVTVRLRYSSTPFSSRSALDDYASGDGGQASAYGPETTLDETLQPGASAEYTVKAEAKDLGLGAYGVYPLAVEALNESGSSLGDEYTFLPYTGGSDPDPIEIAWVWPLMEMPQRAGDDTYLSNGLAESVGANGRLGRLLAVGAQITDFSLEPPAPDEDADSEDGDGDGADNDGGGAAESAADTDRIPITWAVDPALLDDIDRMASADYQTVDDLSAVSGDESPSTADHELSSDAQVWLDQAREVLQDEPLIATPYANPDMAALLRNDLEADAQAAVSLGAETVERILQRPADPSIAWPPGSVMNSATRDFYAENGASTFLLSDTAMPAQSWVGHTPTAQAPLSLEGDTDGTALIADNGLTKVLSQKSSDPGDSALAQQRFAAETAMIAAEQPGTDRTIVAAPPSTWNPGSDFAAGVLAASEDLPWLAPVALEDIEVDSSADPMRQELSYPKKGGSREELDGDHLDGVKAIRKDVRLFNSLLEEDSDPFRPAVLRLESAAWRAEEETADQVSALVARAVEEDMDKVHIIPGEPVTLASKTGTIGVLVANDLDDHTVRVNLSMLSSNPERLSIDDPTETMEIGPGRRTTVYVPLSARINGRTVLHLNLHNVEGEPVSEEQALPVNATGLGTQALLISGIGALVLVIALTPRALRKWARKRAGGDGSRGVQHNGSASAEADAETSADGAESSETTDGS